MLSNRPNPIHVLLISLPLLLTTKAMAQYGRSPRGPNVLLIAVDDLRTELGCYGLPYVQSPNLDRLASQGVLFSNHFVQVPTCGASRYALLTGRSPSRSGALGNNAMVSGPSQLNPQQLDGAQTMPELFRRSDYRTILIGKISHTPDGKVFEYNGSGDGRDEMPNAWIELATPYGSWKRGWGIFFAYANGLHREDGGGHQDLMEFVAENDEDLPDGLMARTAIERLGDLKDWPHPFFMGLGFFKPHLPFVAPKCDWEAMADVDVPPPPRPEKIDSPYWHTSGEFYKYDMSFEKTRPLAAADRITAQRAYLACVRYVDRQIGKVLEELDRQGLAESTIVVVWGDHGWHLGDSAIWGKHSPFERALKSTLIIRAPGASKPGLKCDALVESLDLYPTLVDLCGPKFTKTEHPLDGHSLRPLLNGEKDSIRDAALSYWRSEVSIRTADHRLITTLGKNGPSKTELYEMGQGPDPVENMVEKEPEVVQAMLKRLPAKEGE
jgi:arylsulfatase A-like enzyme